MKVVELFSGVGSQTQALKNIGINHKVVGISDIDKFANKSYVAIHGNTPQLGDITKVKELPECDLLTYSFPCQDISVSGSQKGFSEESNTRSSLLWEVHRLLGKTKPKYLLLENVKNLIGVKFFQDFQKWLSVLNDLGYVNYWQVLNAKDYGIAQNRERVFVVSIRKDVNEVRTPLGQQSLFGGFRTFEFPGKIKTDLRLKDFLEKEVDEKYYLKDFEITTKVEHKKRNEDASRGFGWSPQYVNGIANVITTQADRHCSTFILLETKPAAIRGRGKPPKQTLEVNESDNSNAITTVQKDSMVVELNQIGYVDTPAQANRVYSVDGTCCTINSCGGGRGGKSGLYLDNYRVRRLTPRESWRLMGFKDEQFDLAHGSGMSNAQLYKQAGNSIVVNVLEEIFKKLFDK